jgi:hypothetical protein
LVTARASRVADRAKPSAGAAAAVPVVCRSNAGRRHADGSRLDVVVSGVGDSGRKIGHGNIDANDPRKLLARGNCQVVTHSPAAWRVSAHSR